MKINSIDPIKSTSFRVPKNSEAMPIDLKSSASRPCTEITEFVLYGVSWFTQSFHMHEYRKGS